jgi:septal ring factor EnvC (AmiA/AmiB activator)
VRRQPLEGSAANAAEIQMSKFNPPFIHLRHALALLALLAAAMAAPALAGQSPGALESGISSSTAKASALSAEIQADSSKIDGFQGSIEDLKARLDALETTLGVEKALLDRLKTQLTSARSRLAGLQVELAQDRKVLVAQVVAAYEDPPPSIVTVILEAHGFGDLIERVDDLKAVGQENATATVQVADTSRAVAKETQHLTVLTDSSERETTAVLVQRDEVAHLHLALLDRQLQYIQARNRKSTQLNEIRSHQRSLEKELVAIAVREYAAQSQSFATGYTTESSAPSGEYGFFQAPGTNYSVGVEPILVQRLDTLGKALHLHLIGISGYRTPQHSIEVGGFANDPHTRGEASDTPGIEGVPESILEKFGLTRPFPGPAEADHIQLLGSAP